MLDDFELFSQLCQKQGIIVEQDISEAIKSSSLSGELQLAHSSIIASLCEVIAQVLKSSSTIKKIDFSDCMLLSKGLSSILKALHEGSSVISLYLKGNNISGPLVEQLGDMLIHNNTLKFLHIEWNNLGSDLDAFEKFCDGLSRNHFVEELDLRYNQISSQCSDPLSKALKVNTSLRNVDLSWNSLGMSGGLKILQVVKQNENLALLNLKGNCIPNEILSKIKDQLIENSRKQIVHEIPKMKTDIIFTSDEDDRVIHERNRYNKKSKKRERSRTPLEEMRGSPLGNSGNDDNDRREIKKSSKIVAKKKNSEKIINHEEINNKFGTLDQILQKRAENIDLLNNELELKNAELRKILSENEKLQIEIQRLKEENNKTLEERAKELEEIKKVQIKVESNWKESYRELEEVNENNAKLKLEFEAKNRAYEKELRKASLEVQSVKEKFSSTVQNYEDTISELKMEVHKVKREMQEKEMRCKIETSTLKESLKESTEALEKCQEQLQKLRNDLRESIENQAKLKLKADETERFVARSIKLEDSLHRSKEEREKLEEKLHETRKSIASLQKQLIQLQEESIEPQKRYDALKMELKIEKEKSASLRLDIHDERTRMREQTEQMQKLISQMNGLYTQISDAQSSHAEALRVKEAEVEKLKDVLAKKTRELDEFKSEQVQRAQQFQAAVSKYFGTL